MLTENFSICDEVSVFLQKKKNSLEVKHFSCTFYSSSVDPIGYFLFNHPIYNIPPPLQYIFVCVGFFVIFVKYPGEV